MAYELLDSLIIMCYILWEQEPCINVPLARGNIVRTVISAFIILLAAVVLNTCWINENQELKWYMHTYDILLLTHSDKLSFTGENNNVSFIGENNNV